MADKAPVLYDPNTNLNLSPEQFRTGDLVMTLWVEPGMSLEDWIMVKGILSTTGAKHNHDEPIVVLPSGIHVGYATPPHYKLVPFKVRLAEFQEGKRVFAVFRWHTFVTLNHKMYFEAFQDCTGASIKTMAALKTPYDKAALKKILLLKIAHNWIRRRISLKNIEHNVYCTEGFVLAYSVNGIDILYPIGEQKFPSPIHTERLWRLGYFVMIADFGLGKYLHEGLRQRTELDRTKAELLGDGVLDVVS
jgi:hypothetical protein